MSDYTAGFERWWKTYPAWRRKDKLKCFLLWQKRGLEPRATEVVEKLRADVEHDPAWQKDGQGKQFIPLSHTYLNGGRYDDDKPKPLRTMHTRTSNDDAPAVADLPWHHRMLNRMAVVYMRRAFGLPEVKSALQIKHEVLHEVQPIIDDIPPWKDDKAQQAARSAAAKEAAETIADLFLLRLDLHYKLSLREQIMRAARGRP